MILLSFDSWSDELQAFQEYNQRIEEETQAKIEYYKQYNLIN